MQPDLYHIYSLEPGHANRLIRLQPAIPQLVLPGNLLIRTAFGDFIFIVHIVKIRSLAGQALLKFLLSGISSCRRVPD